jgi:hypothetical protein
MLQLRNKILGKENLYRGRNTAKMEFLNIYLTKHSSHLLHAIHSPFQRQILKKTKLFSGFKNSKILQKKSAKQENLSLFMNSIV